MASPIPALDTFRFWIEYIIIMHWAGVSTVSVQSEQVLFKVLPWYVYRMCIQPRQEHLVCKSDIDTKGHSVNLFMIVLTRNSRGPSRVYCMLTLSEAQNRRIVCYPIAS
jgi:hypothetical protein